MNKYQEYQEAFNNFKKLKYIPNAVNLTMNLDLLQKDIVIFQELVDKEKTYTKEEIKKEWEALGYKWDEKLYADSIALSKRVEKTWLKNETYTETHFIIINIINKTYRAEIFRWLGCEGKPLTFQEHNLLTKTFKMLGWEDSND